MSQVSRATADRMQGEAYPEYLRKCLEIQAYLGEPLYCEWCEAGPEDNAAFEQYVNDEYKKMMGHREDIGRDADWHRQTQELRHG